MDPSLQTLSAPYPPTTIGLGGIPTIPLDVPITVVFLVLYICGAATHMTILQLNLRKSHKFLASGALFGFCMSRIATTSMRIVWAVNPMNVRVALAANILVNAGVVVIIIINLILAQRVLRASHPKLGWHRAVHFAYMAYYAAVILNLLMIISVIVLQSYTLDSNTLRICHDVILFAGTFNAFSGFLPIPIVLLSVITRHTSSQKPERTQKFGTGRFRTKVMILLTGSFLICLGACFRAGTAYVPRHLGDPAWYTSTACFYCFNFMLEIIVVYMYAIVRVDRRFHIPNGSKGPGDYNGTSQAGMETTFHVESEEEFEQTFAPEEGHDTESQLEKEGAFRAV